MQFSNPYILFLLIIVPLMHVFYLWAFGRSKKTAGVFGLSYAERGYKNMTSLLAAAFLIIAMAGPQIGTEDVIVGRKKADIVIAIDASLSMLARDDGNASRFDIAKGISNNLIERLGGARLGLIAFAAKPIILSPLTTDANVAKAFLERADADMFWNQGTSLEMALKGGIEAFNKGEGRKKVMVILTDGEDTEGLSKEVIDDIIKKGIKVYPIGIGETKGSKIPMLSKEGIFTGYKKDRDGNIVVTRLNETVLKDIAAAAGGAYYRQSDLSVDALSQELLAGAEADTLEEKVVKQKNVFQYPLGIAIIFFIIGRIKGADVKIYRQRHFLDYISGGVIYGRK